jgi:phage gp16-like protein
MIKRRLHEMTLETLIQRRDSMPYGDKRIADIDREIALRVRSVFKTMATNGTLAQAIERRLALEQILGPWR